MRFRQPPPPTPPPTQSSTPYPRHGLLMLFTSYHRVETPMLLREMHGVGSSCLIHAMSRVAAGVNGERASKLAERLGCAPRRVRLDLAGDWHGRDRGRESMGVNVRAALSPVANARLATLARQLVGVGTHSHTRTISTPCGSMHQETTQYLCIRATSGAPPPPYCALPFSLSIPHLPPLTHYRHCKWGVVTNLFELRARARAG